MPIKQNIYIKTYMFLDSFSVEKYQPNYQSLWNDFVATSKNATFLFHRDFMDYHKDRFEDYSLMVFKDGKLTALLPANKSGQDIHSHQGLSYGGLLLQNDIKFEDVLESFKGILKFLNAEFIEFLHLKLLPKIYHQLPSDEIDYLLFILNAQIARRDLSESIDLGKLAKIKASNRVRGLKKAIKNGLVVKEVKSFEAFWKDILIPNLQSQHQANPVHSLEEITHLKNRFPKQIRQFNVYKDIEIVAGVTIFESETVAHAQYISANGQKQELGSLDIVFDHLINEVYKNKRYFDFGISNEQQGKVLNSGLLSWKESFGAKPIVHDFYTIDTSNHKFLDSVLK
ncbi:MAG: GNAT family N-acetyltransferase [Gelidibacter sp.]